MTKKEKTALFAKVVRELKKIYPEAVCALEFGGEPWKLLVMGRLSAQCTDARVNIVCRELFEKYPTAKALAEGNIEDIENIVRPCGLFRTKAANIKEACAMLTDEHNGVLPSDMDELLRFPGVGRKIANLLRGDVYKLPAIVADTHCIRICGRLGFTVKNNPLETERVMSELIPLEYQSDFCHRIVLFGRSVCSARKPNCESCPMNQVCSFYQSL